MRSQLGPIAFTLVIAAIGLAVLSSLVRDLPGGSSQATVPAIASPARTAIPPRISFDVPSLTQAPRRLQARFTADTDLVAAEASWSPDPGVPCRASLDTARAGALSCDGLLPAANDFTATLLARAADGRTASVPYRFRTMGDNLTGVRWFTEFEDPRGDPVSCAAASVRIVADFARAGATPSATEILGRGQAFNRSADPGLDPVAIASILHELDREGAYHYYVYPDRDAATRAIVAWLLRTAKPVIAITLAGQHGPVVTGFAGDPGNPTGLVVLDPQRGDLDPRTASRRADKPRSADYQTGRLVPRAEWDRDDWWFGFAYAASIQWQGRTLDIDRSDGAYRRPHWAGAFVIVVADGDSEWPADRQGRVITQ